MPQQRPLSRGIFDVPLPDEAQPTTGRGIFDVPLEGEVAPPIASLAIATPSTDPMAATATPPTFWGRVSDVLTRPLSMTTGGVLAAQRGEPIGAAIKQAATGQSKSGWEDVLEQAGMEDGWGRWIAGTGLDLAADPLNLIPASWIGKAISTPLKLGGKVAGKVATAIAPEASRIASKTAEGLAKNFIMYPGLPTEVRNALRLNASNQMYERAAAQSTAKDIFKGIPQAVREETPYVVEKVQAASTPELAAAVGEHRTVMKDLWTDLQLRGLVDPKTPGIDDYIKYSVDMGDDPAKWGRKVSLADPSLTPRKTHSFLQAEAWAKKNGWDIERDGAVLLADREHMGRRLIANTDLINDLISGRATHDMVDLATSPAGVQKLAEGWKALQLPKNLQETPWGQAASQYVFHPKLSEHVNRFFELPAEVPGWIEALNVVNKIWKPLATIVRPSFHARNKISNVAQMWVAGMRPEQILKQEIRASRLVRERLGFSIKDKTGKILTSEELWNLAQPRGVVGTEFGVLGDLELFRSRLNLEQTSAAERVANVVLNPWSDKFWGRKVGQELEDSSRFALFVDGIERGMSPDNAAIRVKEYLFDYAELTPFEQRYMRPMIPFYVWRRKNVPLMMRALGINTSRMAGLAKLEEDLEKVPGITPETLIPTEERPEFLSRANMRQSPLTSESGETEFYSTGLPNLDLNLIPGSLSQDALRDSFNQLAAGLVPPIKMAGELAAGKEFFTDRPLQDEDIATGTKLGVTSLPTPLIAIAERMIDSPKGRQTLKTLGWYQQPIGGRLVWKGPWLTSYLAKQIPIAGQVGKAVMSGDTDTGAKIPALGGLTPGKLNWFLPTSMTPISQSQRAGALAKRSKMDAARERIKTRRDALAPMR